VHKEILAAVLDCAFILQVLEKTSSERNISCQNGISKHSNSCSPENRQNCAFKFHLKIFECISSDLGDLNLIFVRVLNFFKRLSLKHVSSL
jgi:hypothetical protein